MFPPSSEHQMLSRLFRWDQRLYDRSQNRIVNNKIKFRTCLQAQSALCRTHRSSFRLFQGSPTTCPQNVPFFFPAPFRKTLKARNNFISPFFASGVHFTAGPVLSEPDGIWITSKEEQIKTVVTGRNQQKQIWLACLDVLEVLPPRRKHFSCTFFEMDGQCKAKLCAAGWLAHVLLFS